MRKIICLIMLVAFLTLAPNAIAKSSKRCNLIQNQDSSDPTIIYYINPKEISHLVSLEDDSVTGNNRHVVIVIMTNGADIVYGRYRSPSSRNNAISYIYNIIKICNNPGG